MDFKTVTSNLLKAFDSGYVRYALIGGFAVSLWGYQRDMVDIEALMNIFGAKLDWKRIEGYFELFGRQDTFAFLRLKYYV